MILSVAAQWFAFGLFSLLAVLGGLGMATTMSMFRSGIFLMASFIGVAGLFILLSADLLGLLQVMMYIGGMMVMVMFMVLFMPDPGGSMMAGMKMSFVERFFSRGLAPEQGWDQEETNEMQMGESQEDAHSGHAGTQAKAHGAHSESIAADAGHSMHAQDMNEAGNHDMDMPEMQPGQAMPGHETHSMSGEMRDMDIHMHGAHDMHQMPGPGSQNMSGHDMDMGGMDMSMTTPARPWGIWLGLLIAAGLVLLLLLRPAWPTQLAGPLDPDSPRQIGNLLMSKYMIGFEGAGLLILLGIMGAVFIQRPGSHPSDPARTAYVTAGEQPAAMLERGPLPGEAPDGRVS
ncbi:MAG: NADH-quinone oxidoreductase subunit J [Deinococcus sp.]